MALADIDSVNCSYSGLIASFVSNGNGTVVAVTGYFAVGEHSALTDVVVGDCCCCAASEEVLCVNDDVICW